MNLWDMLLHFSFVQCTLFAFITTPYLHGPFLCASLGLFDLQITFCTFHIGFLASLLWCFLRFHNIENSYWHTQQLFLLKRPGGYPWASYVHACPIIYRFKISRIWVYKWLQESCRMLKMFTYLKVNFS